MTTTFEPHNTTCPHCHADLGPCEEFGCINRYAHDGVPCDRCQASEMTEQGEEP